MEFIYNDGGRAAAGYKGATGDCVCRAIAIATGKSYKEVYEEINQQASKERKTKRKPTKSSARTGVYTATTRKYLASLGWKWVPTMGVGTGCKVHLSADELPSGTLIVKLSGHITTVINGVIHDTYNPCRSEFNNFTKQTRETRCVYGYYVKES